MEKLHLKQEAEFIKDNVYSICLRGARRYPTGEFDLAIYTPEHWENPLSIADIVSQQHFRYCDISEKHCEDNYDVKARNKNDLWKTMETIYDNFDYMEIVTILKFKIL